MKVVVDGKTEKLPAMLQSTSAVGHVTSLTIPLLTKLSESNHRRYSAYRAVAKKCWL